MAESSKVRGRPALNARIAVFLRERVTAMKPGEPFGTEVALVTRIAKPSAPGATVAVPVEFVARESLAKRRN